MGYSSALIDYHDKKGLKGPLKDSHLFIFFEYVQKKKVLSSKRNINQEILTEITKLILAFIYGNITSIQKCPKVVQRETEIVHELEATFYLNDILHIEVMKL
jgi:hypothetical protein